MKYTFIVIVFCLFLASCSSSQNDEKREQDLMKIRRMVDSLKVLKNNIDKSLDSLNSVSRNKDQEMKTLQNQLDSLNRNLKEN